MAEIQFSLIRKIKIGRPQHSRTPSLIFEHLIFALTPPLSPYPQSVSHPISISTIKLIIIS